MKDEVTLNKCKCPKSIRYMIICESMIFKKSFQVLSKDYSGFEPTISGSPATFLRTWAMMI